MSADERASRCRQVAVTISEILRRCTVNAAVGEYGETELNPLRDPKPVELTEERRRVLGFPGRSILVSLMNRLVALLNLYMVVDAA